MRRLTLVILSVMIALGQPGAFVMAAEGGATPNDPDYGKQWYLPAADFPSAWEFAKGSPTVKVAIIDSGVDLTQPDLKDRIWTNPGEIPGNGIDDDGDGYVDDVHGWDFVNDDADPNPDISDAGSAEGTHHGTVVAGIVGAAGNNAEGIAGTNWNVSIMPLRALDSQGNGSTANVVKAVRYAVANGAKVINFSFVGPDYSQDLANALRDAYRAGVIIVAAAGNEGDTEANGNLNKHPQYPVCYKGGQGEPIVIGVAAVDARGVRSSFSSYGSDCISISAPGENFWATLVYRSDLTDYRRAYGGGWSGSSLSSPLVAGAAALLASMWPDITPKQARDTLMAHATDISAQNPTFASVLGAGELDAGASVRAVQEFLLSGGTGIAAPEPPPPALGANGHDYDPLIARAAITRIDADKLLAGSGNPSCATGLRVRSAAVSTVYYCGADGKRYAFTDAKSYLSWYADFSGVVTVSAKTLASIPFGGAVTYRPGVRMVKLQSSNDVYVVAPGETLRRVPNESTARDLYGASWNQRIDDISDAFYALYKLGEPVK